MIELVMICALGFLAASLISLTMLPILNRRAKRLAAARLARRMPTSMPEMVAERDQLRAAHAVAIRHMEQRVEALDARHAALMSETGRQAARIVVLDQQHRADAATIAETDAALALTRQALQEAEATLSAQAVALHDTTSVAERHREKLDATTSQLAATETLVADQRTLLADLQRRLEQAADIPHVADDPASVPAEATEPRPDEVPAAPDDSPTEDHGATARPEARLDNDRPPSPSVTEPVLAGRLTDDPLQQRAMLNRFKAEQEFARRSLAAATNERDRLRLHVDQLLLQIEDLQESVDEAREKAELDGRHTARLDKAIATLKARLAARDDALAAANARLADEAARHEELRITHEALLMATPMPVASPHGQAPRTDAELREAVAALSADLVRLATHAAPATDPEIT